MKNLKRVISLLMLPSLLLIACSNEENVKEETMTDEQMNEETKSDKVNTKKASEAIENESTDLRDRDDNHLEIGEIVTSGMTEQKVVKVNYDINETAITGPFTVTLKNARVFASVEREARPSALIRVELEVLHTSDDANMFSPVNGKLTINGEHETTGNTLLSDDLNGDYIGEEKRSGHVGFTFPIASEEIENLTFTIESGTTQQYEELGENIEFFIDF